MTHVLESLAGDRRFHLTVGDVQVVGRDVSCDLPILDDAVSRRHAELQLDEDGLRVKDLGSRNGTWLNGARVELAHAVIGDTVAFGPVRFTLCTVSEALARPAIASTALDGAASVVRERAIPSRDRAIVEVAGQRLAALVTLAQKLGGQMPVEQLLERIVDDLFGAFPADRVAILLPAPTGAMEIRLTRDANGADVLRTVPRAIADGVARRQVALLTHDASADARTAGDSVMRQSVRSAMAAPLLGDRHTTIGVLYVDNVHDASAFSDEDLHFLVAFAGIAAAAVERETAAAERRHALRVRENFERYFTPLLAKRISTSTEAMTLGGHRQRVIVLFSDIRGFTAIAESLPPLDLATQLNEYFGAIVDCVFAHDGALDKFIGDAVLAYWGAPEPHADDAVRAVRAAQDMQEALRSLNARWREEGRPEWHAGIAMHAGDVFVGNIGSPRRLEYTLIGDTVNITSKLCDLAGPDEILVSEPVRSAIHSAIGSGIALHERPDVVPARRPGDSLRVWAVSS